VIKLKALAALAFSASPNISTPDFVPDRLWNPIAAPLFAARSAVFLKLAPFLKRELAARGRVLAMVGETAGLVRAQKLPSRVLGVGEVVLHYPVGDHLSEKVVVRRRQIARDDGLHGVPVGWLEFGELALDPALQREVHVDWPDRSAQHPLNPARITDRWRIAVVGLLDAQKLDFDHMTAEGV
jgi:hypothetical protein